MAVRGGPTGSLRGEREPQHSSPHPQSQPRGPTRQAWTECHTDTMGKDESLPFVQRWVTVLKEQTRQVQQERDGQQLRQPGRIRRGQGGRTVPARWRGYILVLWGRPGPGSPWSIVISQSPKAPKLRQRLRCPALCFSFGVLTETLHSTCDSANHFVLLGKKTSKGALDWGRSERGRRSSRLHRRHYTGACSVALPDCCFPTSVTVTEEA